MRKSFHVDTNPAPPKTIFVGSDVGKLELPDKDGCRAFNNFRTRIKAKNDPILLDSVSDSSLPFAFLMRDASVIINTPSLRTLTEISILVL